MDDQQSESGSLNKHELRLLKDVEDKSDTYLNNLLTQFYEKYGQQSSDLVFLFSVLYKDDDCYISKILAEDEVKSINEEILRCEVYLVYDKK